MFLTVHPTYCSPHGADQVGETRRTVLRTILFCNHLLVLASRWLTSMTRWTLSGVSSMMDIRLPGLQLLKLLVSPINRRYDVGVNKSVESRLLSRGTLNSLVGGLTKSFSSGVTIADTSSFDQSMFLAVQTSRSTYPL